MSENKKRYFMFVYSYWTKISNGKGNICASVNGFISEKEVKEKATELVSKQWNVKKGIGIVIENIIEMTEEDYTEWNKEYYGNKRNN